MVDVRKYFRESGQALPEEDILATEQILAEEPEEEEGPTPQVPFRYTEHAMNPRAQAVSALAQRDPRARSAFGGQGRLPGGELVMGLPTIDVTFGEGADSFAGRVFDVQSIGQQIGLTDEQIQQALAEKITDERPISEKFKGVSPLTDEQRLIRGLAKLPVSDRISMSVFTRPGHKRQGEDLTTLLKLAMSDNPILTKETAGGIGRAQYGALVKGTKRKFRKGRQLEGDNFMGQLIKGIVLAGMGLMTGGGLAKVLGPAAFGGGLFGSAAAGGIGGAAGGLMTGALQGAASGDWSLRQLGMAAGVGALGGGVAGAAGHLFHGPQAMASQLTTIQNPLLRAQAIGTTLGGMAGTPGQGIGGMGGMWSNIAKYATPATKVLGGGLERGIAATRGMTAAMRAQNVARGQAGTAIGRQQQELYGPGGIFAQRLPESEFYDPNEYSDLGGVQEEIF